MIMAKKTKHMKKKKMILMFYFVHMSGVLKYTATVQDMVLRS